MQSAAVKLIQRQLSTEGFAPGDVDGKLGSNTYAAVEKALLARSEKLPPEWQGGSNARKTVAYL